MLENPDIANEIESSIRQNAGLVNEAMLVDPSTEDDENSGADE